MLHDISISGVGIILKEPPELGQEIVLQVSVGTTRGSRGFSGRVARTMRMPGGEWLVGCTFWRALSEAEVAALLGPDTLRPQQ